MKTQTPNQNKNPSLSSNTSATPEAATLQQTPAKRPEAIERERISQLLHDELQPLLVSAKLFLATIRQQRSGSDYDKVVNRVDEILTESILVSRKITADLTNQSSTDLSLKDIVTWCQDSFGVTVSSEIHRSLLDGVPFEILQSVRELLLNSVKHSGVKTVRLSAQLQDDKLKIVVSDQGAGFDVQSLKKRADGMGLWRMRQRLPALGACLEIQATPGRGSCFTITCPLARAD